MLSSTNSTIYFLHGLDSSGSGTKGQFFAEHFPGIIRPDFSGNLVTRLKALEALCNNKGNLILIGSSYGALMATCHALAAPESIARLILLAPALNYENFKPPAAKLNIPVLTVIGNRDDVTPPAKVLPRVKATFTAPEIKLVDDDHFLHNTFQHLDWHTLLNRG